MKVFYRPEQVCDAACFSPSPLKPCYVVESWLDKKFPIRLQTYEPVLRDDFYLAHDRAYVNAVLNLKTANGFGNASPEVAASLYYTTGSLVAATVDVLENGGVACSPTSGFHHACYASGGGFCTFNGLVVAAIKASALIPHQNILILDIDHHYGNGTVDCLEVLKRGNERTYATIQHLTYGRQYYRPHQADEFLSTRLPQDLQNWKEQGNHGLILYQAGADVHIHDPLGGWMTTEQMMERDDMVFRFAAENRIPLVWNLAGGYQSPLSQVIDLHDNTMRAALKYFAASL